MKTIIKRAKAKTPPFFRKLQAAAITIAAVAGAVLTAPVSLPAAITTAAGYLATAGTVATVLSQLTIKDEYRKKAGTKVPCKGGGNGGRTQP